MQNTYLPPDLRLGPSAPPPRLPILFKVGVCHRDGNFMPEEREEKEQKTTHHYLLFIFKRFHLTNLLKQILQDRF